jgi:hypothetical protein
MNVSGRRQPLAAVLYRVPLLSEAISSALDGLADVWTFPARRGDSVGLLRSIRPDAIIVDDPVEAATVEGWAERHGVPVVEIRLREQTIRVFQGGEWTESNGASDASIRNAVAASLYARGVAS